MAKIIGVQFQKNGKLYYFDPNGIETKVGDYVIVDTSRGHDLGEVVFGIREISEDNWNAPLKKMIRIATEQDIQHSRDNRLKEKDAFAVCQKKISEHKLEMKLVSVEYAFDNSKILFFFTANGRVDFRSLVKDLASVFKMRIELRQIGVRDEAKILGGLGPCGRQICCGTFLDQFQPVSIKMAKEQNLSLNPTKISGVCGRLMCCLKYEQEHYEQTRKKMPKVGREVCTPDGTGPVTDLNIVKETVFVRLVNGDASEIKEYPLESISMPIESVSRTTAENSKKKADSDQDRKQQNRKDSAKREGISDENAAEIRITDSDSMNVPVNEDEKSRNRNKVRHAAVLGQPVRRENPNRPSQGQEADKQVPAADLTACDQKKDEQAAKTKGGWAEALEKALSSIENEQER